MRNVLLHTVGDVVIVMAASGQVRAYEVDDAGALVECRLVESLLVERAAPGHPGGDPGE